MDDSEKTELTPANDNPWYWLATVYGEQTSERIDEDFAKKNRIAWNRWVAAALSEEKRATLIEKYFAAAELTPFSDIEKKEHYDAVLERSGRESITLPEPSERVDLHSISFHNSCTFSGYLFPNNVDFLWATFSKRADFSSAVF